MKVELIPLQIDSAAQLSDITQKIVGMIPRGAADEPRHLVFPELTLTGADAGDYFFRITNAQIDQSLETIKKAQKLYQNKNIYLYVGFPYIINGKRHICHACIKDGEIEYVRGKTELANNINGDQNANYKTHPAQTTSGASGGVEYETRYFQPAPQETVNIAIAGQKNVSFGGYKDTDKNTNPTLIVCEEMFIGVEAGGNLEENPVVKLARKGVKNFVITNASPNANYKFPNRVFVLQKIANYLKSIDIKDANVHYVNWYGTHSAKNLFDGAAHHVHFDDNKNNYVVKSQAHVSKPFVFSSSKPLDTTDEGEFFLRDNTQKHNTLNLPYQNELKNIYPLLFSDAEYAYEALRKNSLKYKGYFVALSGGFDSAFTIATLAMALDIKLRKYVKELGNLESAIKQVCKDLNITAQTHEKLFTQLQSVTSIEAAAAALKNGLIRASYIKTENNSGETEDAARSLAEELGVEFSVVSIDNTYLDIILSYMFAEFKDLDDQRQAELRSAYKKLLSDGKIDSFKECAQTLKLSDPRVILNWKEHGLALENIQARTRGFINWIIADLHQLIPTSNPNFNESINGYTTYCGDLHSGIFSITSHRQKIHIQTILAYLQKYGVEENPVMEGKINPIKSIEKLFKVLPSAELQKLDEDKKTKQTDEEAYGVTYYQLYEIQKYMLKHSADPKQNASFTNSYELLQQLKKSNLFSGLQDTAILKMIGDTYHRFLSSRFKRRAMPIGPATENSIEPHANLRYPLIGTEDYIKADLNMAFMRIINERWVSRNEDKIRLALLTNKEFLNTVNNCRMNGNQIAADTDLKNAFNAIKEPVIDPIVAENNTQDNFVMAANIDSIALNYEHNIRQIKNQIDIACKKGVKLLVFPEFALTGHDLDDAVRFVRNKETEILLKNIADYAQKHNPQLTVAIGHPYVPNNMLSTDRSQRFVSAVSILNNGIIQKTIVKSESEKLKTANSPYYHSRQLRSLSNYQDGVATTDKNFTIQHNGKSVPVSLTISDDITVKVGDEQGDSNSIHIGKLGAPAASTCEDGVIRYSNNEDGGSWTNKPYSFAEENYSTFTWDDKGLELVGDGFSDDLLDRVMLLKQDALFAYSYLRSTNLKFMVSLTDDIDSQYNLFVIRNAIEYRLGASADPKGICAELGIKCENENFEEFENDEQIVDFIMAKKVVVVEGKNNEKLLDKLIQTIKDQHNISDKPFDKRETEKRYQAITGWMNSAIEGAIPVGNGTRTDIGMNKMVFGGDLHQAPISFSLHRSRTEIANILECAIDEEDRLNDVFLNSLNQPLVNLRDQCLKDGKIDLDAINRLKHVYAAWHEGHLARNAMPITLETHKSVDKQTAYQEIPYAKPLYEELTELVLALVAPQKTNDAVWPVAYKEVCENFSRTRDIEAYEWDGIVEDIRKVAGSGNVVNTVLNSNNANNNNRDVYQSGSSANNNNKMRRLNVTSQRT